VLQSKSFIDEAEDEYVTVNDILVSVISVLLMIGGGWHSGDLSLWCVALVIIGWVLIAMFDALWCTLLLLKHHFCAEAFLSFEISNSNKAMNNLIPLIFTKMDNSLNFL
jgi:hypothetical protein